jgi:dephospho-CoA kinase
MNIIGICGHIGSGKDTIADILIKEKGYIKLSFASSLKDAVALIFGWNRKMLEGST